MGHPAGHVSGSILRRPRRSALGLAAACGSDPANVAGTYAMALTNRANGCAIANWTEGPIGGTVTMVVTQSGASASADVQGLARARSTR
jgi:hypothetical protein